MYIDDLKHVGQKIFGYRKIWRSREHAPTWVKEKQGKAQSFFLVLFCLHDWFFVVLYLRLEVESETRGESAKR